MMIQAYLSNRFCWACRNAARAIARGINPRSKSSFNLQWSTTLWSIRSFPRRGTLTATLNSALSISRWFTKLRSSGKWWLRDRFVFFDGAVFCSGVAPRDPCAVESSCPSGANWSSSGSTTTAWSANKSDLLTVRSTPSLSVHRYHNMSCIDCCRSYLQHRGMLQRYSWGLQKLLLQLMRKKLTKMILKLPGCSRLQGIGNAYLYCISLLLCCCLL